MSLIHLDPARVCGQARDVLDSVLDAVLQGAPRCRGNCLSGRRDCTLPGVCHAPRARRRPRPASPPRALTLGGWFWVGYGGVWLAAAVALAVLALAACGGGGDDPGSTGPVHDVSTPRVDCSTGACK